MQNFEPPFRVGKKQKRAVLDAKGLEVVIFREGCEEMAQDYCNFLNDAPFKQWLKLRESSKDEYGDKLCYCGHTFKCSCGNPDLKCFEESLKNKTIILNDESNGW
jgi:hypothetical protein